MSKSSQGRLNISLVAVLAKRAEDAQQIGRTPIWGHHDSAECLLGYTLGRLPALSGPSECPVEFWPMNDEVTQIPCKYIREYT